MKLKLSALGLAASLAACGGGSGQSQWVAAQTMVAQTAQALAPENLTVLNGAYGPECVERDGFWSVRIAGSDPLAFPELSVVKDDPTCTLNVISAVAGQTYTATSPLQMLDTYQDQAVRFVADNTESFHANAKLDSTHFAADFLITFLVSSAPSGESGSSTSVLRRLGSASTFAVLGGSSIANAGPSLITGDIGVSDTAGAVTGFPPGLVGNGTIHLHDDAASEAQADALVAYNALVAMPCETALTGQGLGGRSLTPGVYCFASSAGLTGELVLDALSDPDAIFVFQIVSTLTTAAAASVVLTNNARARNVFWQVGSAATVGANTTLVGNFLAATSVTFTTGASLIGRALVRAAVTLDSNTVTVPP